MAISKTAIRLRIYEATSSGRCAYCGRSFGIVTLGNVQDLDVHHQRAKTMTISRACGYGYRTALKEYVYGDCVWVHRNCHLDIHLKAGCKGPVVII